MIEIAIAHDKPVRIGVNWGSLDPALMTGMMDANAKLPEPRDAREVTREALITSALTSAAKAEEIGLGRDRIILSCKVSEVQDLVAVYADLARRCDYALHLGLTEAGMGSKGIVASAAALSILLQQGIGDTIRMSLTPEPGGDRTQEVIVAQELLQTMGMRRVLTAGHGLSRLWPHDQHSVSRARRRHSRPRACEHAGMAREIPWCRRPESRRHGLCGQRPRRE